MQSRLRAPNPGRKDRSRRDRSEASSESTAGLLTRCLPALLMPDTLRPSLPHGVRSAASVRPGHAGELRERPRSGGDNAAQRDKELVPQRTEDKNRHTADNDQHPRSNPWPTLFALGPLSRRPTAHTHTHTHTRTVHERQWKHPAREMRPERAPSHTRRDVPVVRAGLRRKHTSGRRTASSAIINADDSGDSGHESYRGRANFCWAP